MRSVLKAGLVAVTFIALPFAAQAGTWEGVAIGAGSGMVIAGPPGAVVGGVIGGVVGGPGIIIATAGSTTVAIADAVGGKSH
jgi:hypothetical protein